MFNIIFIISVAVVGFVEWLKNLLPESFKNSKFGLTILSGVISATVGTGYVFAAKPIFGIELDLSIANFLIYALGTVGVVQLSYNVLLQTFKAVVAKLKEKYVTPEIDVDKTSDKIVDKIEETIDSKIKNIIENSKQ